MSASQQFVDFWFSLCAAPDLFANPPSQLQWSILHVYRCKIHVPTIFNSQLCACVCAVPCYTYGHKHRDDKSVTVYVGCSLVWWCCGIGIRMFWVGVFGCYELVWV